MNNLLTIRFNTIELQRERKMFCSSSQFSFLVCFVNNILRCCYFNERERDRYIKTKSKKKINRRGKNLQNNNNTKIYWTQNSWTYFSNRFLNWRDNPKISQITTEKKYRKIVRWSCLQLTKSPLWHEGSNNNKKK